MRVLRQVDRDNGPTGPVALAAGFLDGVHLGHRSVIAAARRRAGDAGGQTWVLTFDPHPLRVLRPDAAPPLITPLPIKLRLLEAEGVDGCIVRSFTPEFAALSPEAFVDGLVRDIPRLAGIAVGDGWRFGHHGAGDRDLLRRLAARHGFDVDLVPPVTIDGQPVSSTRIRQAVVDGRMEEAAGLLGRSFSVEGAVVHGRRIGRDLGFPTANVDALRELHPPAGVYAAWVRADGAFHYGAAYIGGRPTFGASGRPGLEVFLFDFKGDLYTHALEVGFISRIREDRSFTDAEALKDQIALDVARIREICTLDAAGRNP